MEASARRALFNAFVYLRVFAETLASDHCQVATLHVVTLVTNFVGAAVVTGLIDLAADRPRLQWVNGLFEEALLA